MEGKALAILSYTPKEFTGVCMSGCHQKELLRFSRDLLLPLMTICALESNIEICACADNANITPHRVKLGVFYQPALRYLYYLKGYTTITRAGEKLSMILSRFAGALRLPQLVIPFTTRIAPPAL